MQKGQVWRFLTPILVHEGSSHIVFNLITQMIFGSLLEQMIGFKQMAKLYIFSAIGGNLFSAVCTNERSVGASTADFGILTGILAMIFANWSAFDGSQQLEQTRCMLVFMVVLMIVLNFALSSEQPGKTDTSGHLGGAITGMLWGLAFFPRSRHVG